MPCKGGVGRELMDSFLQFKKQLARIHHSGPLPHGEFVLMRALEEHGIRAEKGELRSPGLKISQLSECLHVTRPAISQMVGHLEEKDCVYRQMAKTDRRVVYVCLTPKGKAQLQRMARSYEAVTDRIIERLGVEDARTLIHLMDKLQTIVHEEVEQYFQCRKTTEEGKDR